MINMQNQLKQFKKQEYKFGDQMYVLKDTPLNQVLTVGFNKPFFAFGASEGGKSTMLLDAIVNNIDKVSKFWLFLPESSQKDETMQLVVDKCFIRSLTWNNLYAVYREIKNLNEQANRDVGDLVNLATKLADKISMEEGQKIRSMCQDMNRKLNNEQQNSIKYEVLARYILKCAPNPDDLNDSELLLIQSFITPSTSYMVIFDDVTSTFQALESSKEKVKFNGQDLPVVNAMNALLNEWSTTARHYRNLIIISAHAAKTFLPPVRNVINNVIYCGTEAAGERELTLGKGAKAAASVMKDIIGPEQGYKYYCSIYNSTTRLPEQDRIIITRAKLNDKNIKLNYSPDLQHQLKVYNDVILNNITPTGAPQLQPVETNDDDEVVDYMEFFNSPTSGNKLI